MTETEAKLWIDNMRDCLKAECHTPSMFNELLRFLEELSCPELVAQSKARMGIWRCEECGSIGYPFSHVCGDGS